MVKTYILAPNWTTEPPPDGPIQLGHLLYDLTEFVPVNRQGPLDVPSELLNKVDVKSGFRSSRSRLISGELGLVAKMIGLIGIGAGAGIYYKKDSTDILSCATLETMSFDPTEEYIRASMALSQVARYLEGNRYKFPLYMVTGLKIGRGASLQSSQNVDRGTKMSGGLNPPGGAVNVEGNVGISQETNEEESWEGSTDFVVGFRVRKVWYKKGNIENKANNKNAVMQDNSLVLGKADIALLSGDDLEREDFPSNAELLREFDEENDEEFACIMPAQ